jgi:hypothetical protein
MAPSMYWEAPSTLWSGEVVYIIGGGPSLKTLDLGVLADRRVIGCNDAYMLGPWVGICFFGDYGWYFTKRPDGLTHGL